MPTEVLVPPLGQTVDVVKLVSWYKNEGDAVHQGEPLFVIETDKATLDVEAPASGILRRVTAVPGDDVKVLSAIAMIAGVSDDADEQRSGRAEEHPITPAPLPPSPPAPDRLFISPRARCLAETEGIPLAQVKPTGPEGAIIERDVRAYLQGAGIGDQGSGGRDQGTGVRGQGTEDGGREVPGNITPVARRIAEEAGLDWRVLAGTGPRGQITREDVEAALERRSRGAEEQGSGGAEAHPASNLQPPTSNFQPPASSLQLSGIRAVIAGRMVTSHSRTAPVTLTAEADATALVELRRQLVADGVGVSYNDLFLAILAKALREHPRLNASLDGETIKLWERIDIGLAVDAEHGLLVPVVRDVDRKGLAQLAVETKALTGRARAGKCTPDELAGGTFTLTNLGTFGIDAFTPIINLPECAILGVGRIKTRPTWIADRVEPRQMVWLSLTFDHRLVDGGPAARFLQRVAQLVERPHLLMA